MSDKKPRTFQQAVKEANAALKPEEQGTPCMCGYRGPLAPPSDYDGYQRCAFCGAL